MINVKVVKFLLANQIALLQIVEIAKKWRKDLPGLEQWALVDQIAKIIIPIWETTVSAKSLVEMSVYDEEYGDDVYGPLLLESGMELGALGIDWKLLVDVILPLVISILQTLEAGRKT